MGANYYQVKNKDLIAFLESTGGKGRGISREGKPGRSWVRVVTKNDPPISWRTVRESPCFSLPLVAHVCVRANLEVLATSIAGRPPFWRQEKGGWVALRYRANGPVVLALAALR